MSRYIDADEIQRRLDENGFYELDQIPTVDAVPVVHGHWERCMEIEVEFNGHIGKIYNVRCTACGSVRQAFCEIYDYCPSCGAKMDEAVEDELVNTVYKYEDAANTSTDEVME